MDTEPFHGCKLALMLDGHVLVYERDDDVQFAGMLDLPGGGREGSESPEQCILRELEEEFGLRPSMDSLHYRKRHRSNVSERYAYFFVGQVSAMEIESIEFGDEGKSWQLMEIDRYLEHPKALPNHKAWFREYLSSRNGGAA